MLCPNHLASIEDVSVAGRRLDFLFHRLVVSYRSRASSEGQVMTILRGLVAERMLVAFFVSVQLLIRRAGGPGFGSN